jgi:hypothetical protein
VLFVAIQSSTFTCASTVSQGLDVVNSLDYLITFCPGGELALPA